MRLMKIKPADKDRLVAQKTAEQLNKIATRLGIANEDKTPSQNVLKLLVEFNKGLRDTELMTLYQVMDKWSPDRWNVLIQLLGMGKKENSSRQNVAEWYAWMNRSSGLPDNATGESTFVGDTEIMITRDGKKYTRLVGSDNWTLAAKPSM